MSSFRPIAGNESFSVVENVAGAVKNLDLSEGKIDSVSAGTLNLVGVGLTDAGSQPGRGVVYRAVGYTPAVQQIDADRVVFLNKRPNVAQQTTSGIGANVNSELLLLPDDAIIQKVTIINNSRTAAGALDALTGATGGVPVGLSNVQTASLDLTTLNAELKAANANDAGAATGLNLAPLTLLATPPGLADAEVIGGTGLVTSSSIVTISAATNEGVTVGATTSALTCATPISTTNPTQGFHMVVVIDYLMPGTGTVPGPVASGKWDATSSVIVPP